MKVSAVYVGETRSLCSNDGENMICIYCDDGLGDYGQDWRQLRHIVGLNFWSL